MFDLMNILRSLSVFLALDATTFGDGDVGGSIDPWG